MTKSTYPTAFIEDEKLNFTGIKLALPIFIGYFISEFILSIFSITNREEHEIGESFTALFPTWRIIDAVAYAFAFAIIALQLVTWLANFKRVEFRKKAQRAILAFVLAGIFVIIIEWLYVEMPSQQSKQVDLTVPLFTVIGLHAWAIISLKDIITRLGNHYGRTTGESIFYVLFAANPFIKFALPIILLIFVSLAVNPLYFSFYSEIIMSYLVGVISIGFAATIFKDSRKIAQAQKILKMEQILSLDMEDISEEELKSEEK